MENSSNIINYSFNAILALVFIVCAIPIFLVVSLIIKFKEDGPVLYKGIRLGRNKVPFVMFKFRTLPIGAQKMIGPNLVSSHHPMITLFGKFLRDTRLDELPQLFNILKGDMDFIGPRPERPEIYEKTCRHIRGYDLRFRVKPGLIGYSQLFTPHSTPKKIRSFIDNTHIRKTGGDLKDNCLIFYTIFLVIKLVLIKGTTALWSYFFKEKLLAQYISKRSPLLNRVKPKNVKVFFRSDLDSYTRLPEEGKLVDMNENSFLINTRNRIVTKRIVFILEKTQSELFEKRKIKCECTGEIYRETALKRGDFNYLYSVINYKPLTDFDYFKMERYLLRKSMV